MENNYLKEQYWDGMGLEDIRMFTYNNITYYLATYFEKTLKRPMISSNIYSFDDNNYRLQKTYIYPSFYNFKNTNRYEKNWSFFKYKSKLHVIYNWFPLQIGIIDYKTNSLNITEIKHNIPEYFKTVRGSTCGQEYNNELWFVVHKSQNDKNKNVNKRIYNYQHIFAIFDLNMNILRYSETFKLGGTKIEFCTGFIIENGEIILSYSLQDTSSFISKYDINTINEQLKWYTAEKIDIPDLNMDTVDMVLTIPKKNYTNVTNTNTNDIINTELLLKDMDDFDNRTNEFTIPDFSFFLNDDK